MKIKLKPITEHEYQNLLSSLNSLSTILVNIHECHDIWLSDVQELQELQYKLQDVLGAEWDKNKYRYVMGADNVKK